MSHLAMLAGLAGDEELDEHELDPGPQPPRPPDLGDLGFDWEEPTERLPRRRRLELVVVDPLPLWPEVPDRLVSLAEQSRRRARRPFDQELER